MEMGSTEYQEILGGLLDGFQYIVYPDGTIELKFNTCSSTGDNTKELLCNQLGEEWM